MEVPLEAPASRASCAPSARPWATWSTKAPRWSSSSPASRPRRRRRPRRRPTRACRAPTCRPLLDRRALLGDAARPEAVARRHAPGGRSARENVADLLDAGSLLEYGAFAVAAQRSRRSLDDLQRNTPADGLITGTGSVNAALFGPSVRAWR